MLRRVVFWLLTLIWIGVIFYFSSQPAPQSADLSRKVTEQIVHNVSDTQHVVMDDSDSLFKRWHTFVRKMAHFFLYLGLGVLAMNLCLSYKLSNKRTAFVSLVFSALYALFDEMHQHFVPGRCFLWTDVLLDSISALLGMSLVWGSVILIKKLKNSKILFLCF